MSEWAMKRFWTDTSLPRTHIALCSDSNSLLCVSVSKQLETSVEQKRRGARGATSRRSDTNWRHRRCTCWVCWLGRKRVERVGCTHFVETKDRRAEQRGPVASQRGEESEHVAQLGVNGR